MSRFYETSHAHDGSDAHRVEYGNLLHCPPNYGLLTTASRPSANVIRIGAGTGAVVFAADGRPGWVSLPVNTDIEDASTADTKYPYLVNEGEARAYLSATAPTYDAQLGYWTDGAGGRWLGLKLAKSAASTFYDFSAVGGANAATLRYSGDITITTGAQLAAASVDISITAYAVESAIRAMALAIRNDTTATGRHTYRVDSGSPPGPAGAAVLGILEWYTTGTIAWIGVLATDTPTAIINGTNTLAIGAGSYVRLRRVTHTF